MPFVSLKEFPTFGRVATWEEWRNATGQALPDFLFPWFVSNMLGFVLLWIAVKYPWFSRKAWGALMILASIVNSYAMLFMDPTGYHEFGVLAIPPMQHFIYSKFFANPAFLVLAIALCQLLVGIILLLGESPNVLKAGLAGTIVWFLSITPLGLMSGFPSSLTYATTMVLCWPPNTSTHKQKIS